MAISKNAEKAAFFFLLFLFFIFGRNPIPETDVVCFLSSNSVVIVLAYWRFIEPKFGLFADSSFVVCTRERIPRTWMPILLWSHTPVFPPLRHRSSTSGDAHTPATPGPGAWELVTLAPILGAKSVENQQMPLFFN